MGASCGSSEKEISNGVIADRIMVEKSIRRLTLMKNGIVLKSYKVALGRKPIGDKEREGDNRTPEGIYKIDRRNARSRFYRALHISYPTPSQIDKSKKLGVGPGGDILIHGLPSSLAWVGSMHRMFDWTAGCVAVTNAEIDEIWRVVPDDTTVEIKP